MKKDDLPDIKLTMVNYTPISNVEGFLNTKFNVDLFEMMQKNDFWKKNIEPLEFFNTLYEQYGILLANKFKPLSVTAHLLKLKVNWNYSLIDKLIELIDFNENCNMESNEYYRYDAQLEICQRFLRKEIERMDDEAYIEYCEHEERLSKEGKSDFYYCKYGEHFLQYIFSSFKNGLLKEGSPFVEAFKNKITPDSSKLIWIGTIPQFFCFLYLLYGDYHFPVKGDKERIDEIAKRIALFPNNKDKRIGKNIDKFILKIKTPKYWQESEVKLIYNAFISACDKLGIAHPKV